MRTSFVVAAVFFSLSVSAQDLSTVSIDFSSVLGPEVTACPVADSASISVLHSCEDESWSRVFKKCLVGVCGTASCSWYKTVVKSCLNTFCPGQTAAWSDWVSSECSLTGTHKPYSLVLTHHRTSLDDSTTSQDSTTSTDSAALQDTTTSQESTTLQDSVPLTSTATAASATTKAVVTESSSATSISATQSISSSASVAKAAAQSADGFGAIIAGFFGVLAAMI